MIRILTGLFVILAALVADTISSAWMVIALFGNARRAARARDRDERWGCVLCKLLDRIDSRHCDQARGQ